MRSVSDIEIKFIGERKVDKSLSYFQAGTDAQGLKRELINYLSLQIIDPDFGLFVPSPNQRQNIGAERNKLVPNPKALGLEQMRNFYMVGQFLALAFRIRDNISLDLPSIFWKFLISKIWFAFVNILDHSVEWSDVKSMDLSTHKCLEDIEKMDPENLEYLDQNFTIYLPDSSEHVLKPNG